MTFEAWEIALFVAGCIGLVVAIVIGETGAAPVFRRRRRR